MDYLRLAKNVSYAKQITTIKLIFIKGPKGQRIMIPTKGKQVL